MSEPSDSLREQFGDIDVYLFDQLLRGPIVSGMKVRDAGCGCLTCRPSFARSPARDRPALLPARRR